MTKSILPLVLLFTLSLPVCHGQGTFEPADVIQLPAIEYSGGAWGDYDNDGDLDLAVSGRRSSWGELGIFRNDGAQGFRRVPHQIRGVAFATAEWGDYDGDGDLDLLLSSYLDGDMRICANLGRDAFREVYYQASWNVGGYQAHWLDLNRDGRLEVVGHNQREVFQYKYSAAGGFVRAAINGLPENLDNVTTAWGDYDNDGDMDVFLRGADLTSFPYASREKIYRNDGRGNFSLADPVFREGSNPATWADVDADGDLDLATVYYSGAGNVLLFYLNNGNGTFAEKEMPITNLSSWHLVFADYDNDGDNDMVLNSGGPRFYTNGGNLQFVHDATIDGGDTGTIPAFGDYDNDGDLDVVLAGNTQSGGKLLRNVGVEQGRRPNRVPAAPLNPRASLAASQLTLSWNPATDAETPQRALQYALYIRQDTMYQASPHGNPVNGYRLKADGYQLYRDAGAQLDVAGWPEGHYTWAVQAVDGAFAGSPFSTRGEFTLYRNNPAGAPGPLVVSAVATTSVGLSWQDNAADETGFAVERAAGRPLAFEAVAALAPNATGYADAGLLPNTTYYYRVKMTRSSGAPAYSPIAQTQTLPVITSAPALLTARPLSPTQVGLQWQDHSADETGFQVERSKDAAGPFVAVARVAAGATGYTDEGLSAGTKYLYRVRAVNEAGTSAYSNLASTATLAQPFAVVPVPQINTNAEARSVAVADYDNDGYQDVFVAGTYGMTSTLYHNTGEGTFAPADTALFKSIGFAFVGSCVWGDYDNDGYADLFVAITDGPDHLYHNLGENAGRTSHFEEITFGDMVNQYTETQSANWVDYDSDGDLDLFGFTGSSVLLYRNDGNDAKGRTVFSQVTTGALGALRGRPSSSSWADYDNDGDLDVCIGDGQGRHLYANQGDGVFTKKTDPYFSTTEVTYQSSSAGSWGDYDNDGDLDLLVPSGAADGYEYYPPLLMENTGKGPFKRVTGQRLVTEISSGVGSSWVDYDNDGWLDLSLMGGPGRSRLYGHNGDQPATFSPVFDQPAVGEAAGTVTGAWADFNHDGAVDFFTGTHLLLNGGNPNGWLNIRLRGSVSNALGVGARVFVKANGRWMQQYLTTQHGYKGQNGFELVFGLGSAPVADSIRVEWPSGTRQHLAGVTANQRLLIREADAAEKPVYAPANLLARVLAPARVGLAWQDNATGETGFVLERAVGSDSTRFQPLASLPADATAYFDNTVALGSTYFYRVKAVQENAAPPWSRVARVTVSQFAPVFTGRITKTYFETFGSATWGDYDNDGWQDLFVANRSRHFLYRNTGEGPGNEVAFLSMAAGPLVQHDFNNHPGAAAWVDTDNDGDLDLFIPNGSGISGGDESLQDRLYRNDGNGAFTRMTEGPLANSTQRSHQGAWGDYDNDGRVDVFTANGYGGTLYHNEGNNAFAVAGRQPAPNNGSRHAAWCDYDNDGDLDLFSAGYYGANLYVGNNNGRGEFTDATVLEGTAVNFSFDGFSFGDYDRDGWMDFVATGGTGCVLYRNQGKGAGGAVLFAPVTPNPLQVAGQNPTSSSWGDYDNDGWPDLLVTFGNEQENVLFHNDGKGSFTQVTGEPVAATKGNAQAATWVDYDNDGDLDLFVGDRHQSWGESRNKLYQNNGTQHNWLEVKLAGVVSNAAAIGARLKVFAGGRVLVHDLATSSGRDAGNPLVAHFGLGEAVQADYLKVEWPSGTVQWLEGVPANQIIRLQEAEKRTLAPVPPYGLTARATSPYAISLFWSDNSDNEEGFYLERSLTGGEASYAVIATLPANAAGYAGYQDVSLEPATTYHYRVRARIGGAYTAYAGTQTTTLTTTPEPNPTGIDPGGNGGTPRAIVYPVPARREVTVLLAHNTYGEVTLDLFDALGRRRGSHSFRKTDFEARENLSLAGLPRGRYLLRITLGDTVLTKTVLKMTE